MGLENDAFFRPKELNSRLNSRAVQTIPPLHPEAAKSCLYPFYRDSPSILGLARDNGCQQHDKISQSMMQSSYDGSNPCRAQAPRLHDLGRSGKSNRRRALCLI